MSDDKPAVEIYPMPLFVTLSVYDPAASARWYQEALGFQHVHIIPGRRGEPALIHLRWAKYADLLLRRAAPDAAAARGAGVTLSFTVAEGSVDALAERAHRHGARIVSEPKNRPWNARDFSVADPDGYVLTFTWGPVEPGLGMDRVIARSTSREQS